MKLVPEWIDTHSPEAHPLVKAEADCPCGIRERHRHCAHCGKVVTIGDWDAPGVLLGTIRLPRGGLT